MDIDRFSQTQRFIDAALGGVVAALTEVFTSRTHAVLAVPGGRTARALLPHLANATLAWHRVVITLTDERWVPVTHDDSNEGLVRATLAGPAKAARLLGLFREGITPDRALPDLIAHMPAPDVILLGMGEDGHVASIFPNDASNHATASLAIVARPDHHRITITPPVLRRARRIILAITGAAKQAAIEQARREGPPEALPVRHALVAGAAVFIGPDH